ncbi:MAG: IclR family transcriptional regulator [Burkholderiales bacterium]|nr:IclR family transcriptional regulator [Burkholderiales bacterium]
MPPSVARPDRSALAYSAPALEKGLEIIELLAQAEEPLSTRAIADRLGRSKGEIFRMVFVLVERGYLLRDPVTDELKLSNRLFELGMRTPRSRQLVEVAAPAMEHLSERIGQSSHLVVVNRGETVVIAAAVGGADLSFTLRLGYRRSALEATSGQIILAFQDRGRRARMIDDALESADLAVDRSEFEARLDAIAARGHLVAQSHDVVGVTDIGAPILGRHGRAMAAIVVPYLNRHRAKPEHDSVLADLVATCRAIADELN